MASDLDLWEESARVINGRPLGTSVQASNPIALTPADLGQAGVVAAQLLANQGPIGLLTPLLIGSSAYLGAHLMRRHYPALGAFAGAIVGWELVLLLATPANGGGG